MIESTKDKILVHQLAFENLLEKTMSLNADDSRNKSNQTLDAIKINLEKLLAINRSIHALVNKKDA